MRRAAALALVLALGAAAPAAASRTQESMFQDDDLIVYGAPDGVASTFDTLQQLGVDRVRASVFWKVVAPDAGSQTRPASFDAANPDAYPPGSWDRYDEIVRLAQARGLQVNFDITGPAPKWATGNPQREDIDETYTPDPQEFDWFVRAVGTRYSGSFAPAGGAPLPRVSYWEIWNEPNQAGWLTPQWQPDPADAKAQLAASPQIYRSLADGAWDALAATGHGTDTILVGSTAPKGLDVQGETRSIKPLPFIRALYCLDDHLQFFRGEAAKARGCPESGQAHAFPAAHPELFRMTGWAHHPYELTFAPDRRPADPDFATIANLDVLSTLLRKVFQRYGQPEPKGGVPLYLTEFGYQTNPPDPLGVSPARQASYRDQAEYMTWCNRRVRTLSQFLLVDGGDPVGLTFQSGLRFHDGRDKPAMGTYRLPVWLPKRRARRGSRIAVWGLVRPAATGTAAKVAIQFRARHGRRWRTISSPATSRAGYLERRVKLPGTGAIRLLWNGVASRTVGVTAARAVKRRR
jgi:hypothetical protein